MNYKGNAKDELIKKSEKWPEDIISVNEHIAVDITFTVDDSNFHVNWIIFTKKSLIFKLNLLINFGKMTKYNGEPT